MKLPNHGLIMDEHHSPMSPEISCSSGATFWRKVGGALPDSNSVLDFCLRDQHCHEPIEHD